MLIQKREAAPRLKVLYGELVFDRLGVSSLK